MQENSLLIDHPLIQRYLQNQKIKNFNENTLFPLGLLAIVYEDYTGQKVSLRSIQKGRGRHSRDVGKIMITFGQFFSHDCC